MIFNWFKKSESTLLADIDISKKFICIQTISSCGLRISDPDGVSEVLAVTELDGEIAKVLRRALTKSRHLTSREYEKLISGQENSELRKRFELWLKKYGYKSKREYYRETKSISVEEKSGSLIFVPSHQDSLNGYTSTAGGSVDNVIIPAESSPEEIGKALRLALSRCTSKFD